MCARKYARQLQRQQRLNSISEERENIASARNQEVQTTRGMTRALSEPLSYTNFLESNTTEMDNTTTETDTITDRISVYHETFDRNKSLSQDYLETGPPTGNGTKMELKVNSDEDEIVTHRESSGKVLRVGAVPFEVHEAMKDKEEPNYGTAFKEKQVNGNHKNMTEDSILGEEASHSLRLGRETSLIKTREANDEDDEIALKNKLLSVDEYHSDIPITLTTDISSSKGTAVLLYLDERNIEYNLTKMSFQNPEHLVKLSQLISQANIPTLQYNQEESVFGTMTILNFLEEKVPLDQHPMMIPCTSSTKCHQQFILYASLLDNIDLDALTLGRDVHPSSSSGPDMTNLRSTWKSELEKLKLFTGECSNKASLERIIQQKEASLNIAEDEDKYKLLLKELDDVLGKLETKLDDDNDGDTAKWTLGDQFSALDMILGVVLHNIHKLNCQEQMLKDRTNLKTFWKQVRTRSSFQEIFSVTNGIDEGKKVNGVGNGIDPELEVDDTEISVLFSDKSTETSSQDDTNEDDKRKQRRKDRKKLSEDRTWYSLW